MRSIPKSRIVGLFASMLLLSSCATGPHPSATTSLPALPRAVTMNKDAGRGGHLYVTLRLDGGEKLPFFVDTGAPTTVLAKSLEPRLGKCLGTTTLWNFGTKYEGNIYPAPKLYLGKTLLITDSNTITSDIIEKMSSRSGRPVMGILGMDCLHHYCIQLDFRAGKMRFLDPDHLPIARLGQAFPVTFSRAGPDGAEPSRLFMRHSSLVGGEDADLLIDTGANVDGLLQPELFQRERQEEGLHVPQNTVQARDPNNVVLLQCVWSGAAYTDLWMRSGKDAREDGAGENALGLRFLARHLVTFDFPHQIMYLKQTRRGPLVTHEMNATAKAAADSAYKSVRSLAKKGQLPGWSRNDRGKIRNLFHVRFDPESVTFDLLKRGDPSTYHYELTRASKDGPWQLHTAWRTDQDDHTVEEYPVP